MNCERAQEIILTDYLDQELDQRGLNEIERHLSGCAHCREFLTAARQATITPFSAPTKVKLPQDKIWQNIKNQIEEESQSEFVNPLLVFSKPLERKLMKSVFVLDIKKEDHILPCETAVRFPGLVLRNSKNFSGPFIPLVLKKAITDSW